MLCVPLLGSKENLCGSQPLGKQEKPQSRMKVVHYVILYIINGKAGGGTEMSFIC